MKYIYRDHRISINIGVYHLCIWIFEVPLSALGNILNPTLSTCLYWYFSAISAYRSSFPVSIHRYYQLLLFMVTSPTLHFHFYCFLFLFVFPIFSLSSPTSFFSFSVFL